MYYWPVSSNYREARAYLSDLLIEKRRVTTGGGHNRRNPKPVVSDETARTWQTGPARRPPITHARDTHEKLVYVIVSCAVAAAPPHLGEGVARGGKSGVTGTGTRPVAGEGTTPVRRFVDG